MPFGIILISILGASGNGRKQNEYFEVNRSLVPALGAEVKFTDAHMSNETMDREFVEYLIKQIVNHPDKVEVKRTVDEMGVLLSVKVDKDDMGLLIGRAGSTAKAIRTLARIVGMRNNARVNLRIEEPVGGTGGHSRAANIDDIADLNL